MDNNIEEKKKQNRIRRAKMRKMADMKASGISVLIFFAFVLLIALLLLFIPREKVSNVEKRSLAQFPVFSFADYFSGEFTSGVTEYYDDTVPLRDGFKNASNNIKTIFGIHPKTQAEFIGVTARNDEKKNEEASTASASDNSESATQKTTEPETESYKEDEINKKDYDKEKVGDATLEEGILVVFQDGHYRGISLAGDNDVEEYVATANYLRENLDDKIKVYFMPIPLTSEYYVPANYSEYASDLHSEFKRMYSEMDQSIVYVDVVDTLRDHNEEPIYLRTDHHWAPLGAYYAAKEMAKAAGVPYGDLETDYDEVVNEGYVGTLYAFTGNANLLNDPEDFVYYVAKNKYIVDYYGEDFDYFYTDDLYQETDTENSYLAFYRADDIITRVTTDVKNGRKLLIIKDSYGNAQVPFYTHSFEEIYVIDQRYCHINVINFVDQMGITDVLLTNNAYMLTGAGAYLLDQIITGYTDVPIVDEAPKAKLPGEQTTEEKSSSDNDSQDTEDISGDDGGYLDNEQAGEEGY